VLPVRGGGRHDPGRAPERAAHEQARQLAAVARVRLRTIDDPGQRPNGYWAPSLLDVAHDPLPETSGTAFITFGLAWGLNRHILPADEHAEAVEKGWAAITAAVDDHGEPGRVRQVGNAPDEVRASDTQLYGSGAVLLAASEMLLYLAVNQWHLVED
jgi:rhamnogalacturonyl hydrolase YesR